MNNVIKKLMQNTISEIIANGKCLEIDGTCYFLDDGVLYSFKYYKSEPQWIERFDYSNTEGAILMFANYLSNMIDVENVEIVDMPKPTTITVWR